MKKLKFGMTVKHKINGYTGIYTARAIYMTGCNKIGVTSTELDKDGEVREMEWFDETNIVGVENKKQKPGAEGMPPSERM